MQIIVYVVLVVALVVGVWIASLVPRARRWIAKCDAAVRDPLPVWTPPRDARVADAPLPSLDRVDWTSLSKDVDGEGVHVFDYDATSQRGIRGKHRNPSNIAVFAIKRARRYLENRETADLLLALRQLEYLIETARPVVIDGREGVVWCADFDAGYSYHVKVPWKSAYFQIFSMNALLWGGVLTGDSRYRDVAEKGLLALGRTVDEGGLCHRTPGGGFFFEEVVSSPLHHILNGHLHTLINIHEYGEFTGLKEASGIFALGVRGTIDMLPLYDRNGYSLYSLAPERRIRNHFAIANPWYHRSHTALLRRLQALTGEPMLGEYADRWRRSCGRGFDTVWSMLLIAFRDGMKIAKRLRR